MKETQLLTVEQSKAKSRFINRLTIYKKGLQEMENNVAFEKPKRHRLMAREMEIDIVLVFCNVLKYLLLAIVLLCLYASW